MTAANPASPAPVSSRPAGAPGGAPRGVRPPPPTIDPVRVLRQHAWLLVGAAVVGAVLGTIANYVCLYAYPLWGATVTFEVRPQVQRALEAVTMESGGDESIARLAATESQRILTRQILETAMAAPDISSTVWGQQFPTVDERVQELQEELRGGHRSRTQLFTLSWRTHERGDVATVLNRVARTYLAAREAQEDERSSRNKSSFETKRSQVEEQIRNLKTEVQDFIRRNGITAGSEQGLFDQGSAGNLGRLREDTVRDLTLAQARLDAIDRKLREQRYEDEDRRIAMQDPSVRQIEQSMHQIQLALNTSRERYGEEHPQVKDLVQRDAATRERLKVVLDEAMQRNLQADKLDYSQRVSSLKSLVERQTQDLTDYSKRLQEATAQFSALNALREQLDQKEKERADLQNLIAQFDILQGRADSRRVTLVQEASPPREIEFPKLKLMLPAGVFLSVLVVAGTLFLREFLDQRVRFPSDLAGVGGARLLGVIPDIADDPSEPKAAELVVAREAMSSTAEMFRQLAAACLKGMDAAGAHSLAVVTSNPGGGTTTVASNLAASFRAAGRTVAVVDANLRRPRLSAIMGEELEGPGLGDMLQGQDVQPHMANGIAVYGPGTVPNRIYERVSTDEMRRIIARLRERYQVVIVDLPPTLVAGETMFVTEACDASLLVVRALEDQRGLVAKSIHRLQEAHAVLLGTVLMRPEQTAGGYFRKNAEVMAAYAQPASSVPAAPAKEPVA
jgi:succinoglycan biosynthesis transport protein ExoP